MAEESYESLANGMADHYVQLMPDRMYQVVGRGLIVPGKTTALGVMRVNFDDRRIYAEDIEGDSVAGLRRELVAEEFCDKALSSLQRYSCEPVTSVPLTNIDSIEELDYDLYFENREVFRSAEAQEFFREIFGVDDIEDEFQVRFPD